MHTCVRPSVRVSSFSRAVTSFCFLLFFYALSILRRSKPPSKEKVIRQVELEWGRFIRRLSDVACRWGYSTTSPPPPPAHNQADRKISSFSCCLISDPIPLFLCAVEFVAVLCTLQCPVWQCYEYPYRLCQQCKLFNFTKCIN